MDDGVLKLVLSPSQLSDGFPVLSEPVTLRSLPWRLMVLSQDVMHNSQGNRGRTVGLYVQCVPDAPGSLVWSAPAHVKVKIQNHLNPEKSFTKAFEHKYSNSSTDWGYSSLIKWKDLTDPGKGFLKDDNIFVEATIKLKVKSEAVTPPVLEMGGVVDSVLLCPNCTEEYQIDGERLPMSLKCGHTFCAVCLQKASVKSGVKTSLKCPSCNQLHVSESGEGAGLWFPNHSMVQIIEGVASKSKFFCQVHRHDKNFYCFDCKSLVCIYCAYHGKHSTHSCKHMDDAAKEADHTLRKVKLGVSTHVSEMERRLQFVQDEREMLKTQQASIQQAIEDSFEQLKTILLKQKELLFQELKDHTSVLNSGIDSNSQKLEEQFSKVKGILNDFTTWQNLSPREGLEKFNEVHSSLSSIPSLCSGISPSSEHQPPPRISFELRPLSEALGFGQLGRLVLEAPGESSGVAGVAGSSSSSCEPEGDFPPNKRRKKTS